MPSAMARLMCEARSRAGSSGTPNIWKTPASSWDRCRQLLVPEVFSRRARLHMPPGYDPDRPSPVCGFPPSSSVIPSNAHPRRWAGCPRR